MVIVENHDSGDNTWSDHEHDAVEISSCKKQVTFQEVKTLKPKFYTTSTTTSQAT